MYLWPDAGMFPDEICGGFWLLISISKEGVREMQSQAMQFKPDFCHRGMGFALFQIYVDATIAKSIEIHA